MNIITKQLSKNEFTPGLCLQRTMSSKKDDNKSGLVGMISKLFGGGKKKKGKKS